LTYVEQEWKPNYNCARTLARIDSLEITGMISTASATSRLIPITVVLAALWSSGSQALLIDNFDTPGSAAVTTAAPGSDSDFTLDSGPGMIGNRTIAVNKTAGGSGGANGAYMDSTGLGNGGVLSMANGNSTNSIDTALWTFSSTDLTEGGTMTGLFLVLPNPIDNDLYIGFSLNGGALYEQLFPNGSQGNAFFFAFSNFANPGAAAAATSVLAQFRGSNAWDAEIDFIETFAPPDQQAPVPSSLSLVGLCLAGLGWSRRKQLS
jgi:hypothetical protein